MIASTRGLLVLLGIAVVLAAALIVGGSGQRGAIDRSLVPGFEASKATELSFIRPESEDVVLTKQGDAWHWVQPPGVADAAAIDGVLTALRGAHWHRRAARRVAGATRGEVRVNVGGNVVTIAVAAALEGADQTWLVHGDSAYLVDDWVANALVPEPLALRMRQPLAAAGAAEAIVATGIAAAGEIRIEGARLVKPQSVWLDPAKLRAVQDAMAGLQIVALPPAASQGAPRPHGSATAGSGSATPSPGSGAATSSQVSGSTAQNNGPSVVISLEGPAGRVAFAGACGAKRVLLRATDGDGCVEERAWDAVVDALRALDQPADKIADPRPLPVAPAKLVLADGTEVDVAGRPRVGNADADPDRVRELVGALMTPGVAIPRPSRKPMGTVVATDAAGTSVTLDVFDGGLVARHGEDVAIHVFDEPWKILMRPSAALRDPVLWREDETTIESIRVDGVTFTRGQLIGEWTRTPPGKVDAALVDALAEALATVRAPASTKASGSTRKVVVTFAPPAGAPVTHELAIAPPAGEGCAATVDGAPVMLPLQLCTAAFAVTP